MGPPQSCPGCGGAFPAQEGATHRYMKSSPGCWARYGLILAREYAEPALLATHRLSVDAYAVQHPGGDDRRAIQSVGLHLARLWLLLEVEPPPHAAQAAMLRFGDRKSTLPRLTPPAGYTLTVADIPVGAAVDEHVRAVTVWAGAAWEAWAPHHAFIITWARTALAA